MPHCRNRAEYCRSVSELTFYWPIWDTVTRLKGAVVGGLGLGLELRGIINILCLSRSTQIVYLLHVCLRRNRSNGARPLSPSVDVCRRCEYA